MTLSRRLPCAGRPERRVLPASRIWAFGLRVGRIRRPYLLATWIGYRFWDARNEVRTTSSAPKTPVGASGFWPVSSTATSLRLGPETAIESSTMGAVAVDDVHALEPRSARLGVRGRASAGCVRARRVIPARTGCAGSLRDRCGAPSRPHWPRIGRRRQEARRGRGKDALLRATSQRIERVMSDGLLGRRTPGRSGWLPASTSPVPSGSARSSSHNAASMSSARSAGSSRAALTFSIQQLLSRRTQQAWWRTPDPTGVVMSMGPRRRCRSGASGAPPSACSSSRCGCG